MKRFVRLLRRHTARGILRAHTPLFSRASPAPCRGPVRLRRIAAAGFRRRATQREPERRRGSANRVSLLRAAKPFPCSSRRRGTTAQHHRCGNQTVQDCHFSEAAIAAFLFSGEWRGPCRIRFISRPIAMRHSSGQSINARRLITFSNAVRHLYDVRLSSTEKPERRLIRRSACNGGTPRYKISLHCARYKFAFITHRHFIYVEWHPDSLRIDDWHREHTGNESFELAGAMPNGA
ncbi:hypothetical protein [Burkholderia sp. Ac-20379]|uniref:hypothetical protein n=1 Tax=Burkholderia sp. Ac-20379 TaxID=2703900 RepID=UPI001981DDD7|nr:hypothetical protein [Burkholderia sp. Ac-20379]MBN3726293.1 hypothetical protein [Burkholderia sp. Ac-20379]